MSPVNWRDVIERLRLRFELWLASDESELDWSADDALEQEDDR